MSCVIGAKYNMTAQIMRQTITQSRSGAVSRDYVADGDPVKCLIMPTRAGGVAALGSAERFNNEYADNKVLKMKTSRVISQRSQVTNIRARNGGTPWGDDVFEVSGYVPVIGPFGEVLEYEYTLEKA